MPYYPMAPMERQSTRRKATRDPYSTPVTSAGSRSYGNDRFGLMRPQVNIDMEGPALPGMRQNRPMEDVSAPIQSPQMQAPQTPLPRLQDTFGLRQNFLKTQAPAAQAGAQADMLAPYIPMTNYTQPRQFTGDANNRANMLAPAQVGLMGSQAGMNNAVSNRMTTIAPAEAAMYSGRGAESVASANQMNTMTPFLPQLEQQRVDSESLSRQLDDALRRVKELESQITKQRPGPTTQPSKPTPVTEEERMAAQEVGYPAVMGMRQGYPPGSPATQPVQQQPNPGSAGQGPARIQTDDEYNQLPSGSMFIGPDGMTRRKP